jgi:Ser/Thr protein kinase RdoA (MazF antagonist)
LSPSVVLDALDAGGWRGDGRVVQLNSFENRVWLVPLEAGGAVVTKFYRPGRWSDAQILEEHAYSAALAAAEVPVAAPLADPDGRTLMHIDTSAATAAAADTTSPSGSNASEHWRFAVFERKPGRGPELEDPGVIAWIGRFLARLHTVGAAEPFVDRPTLDAIGLAQRAADDVTASPLLPLEQARSWRAATDGLIDAMRRSLERLPPPTTLRLHGDCHLGNILWTEAGPHFVDLDDAVNGPAVQDLWMLLAGDAATAEAQTAALLEGYESVREFDRRELRLIEVLRSARMLHYAAWILRRWHDPAFPAAFPWFGDAAYWSELTSRLKDQRALLEEALLSWPPAWH